MTRFVPLLAFALLAACGLAEDERDDKNKRVYITFADPAFEAYCLEHFDIDHDGRISRYEAQRVLKMDCPDRGIAHMWEIGDFSRLERLDCSENRLASLDVEGLRALVSLDCGGNPLRQLNLSTNASLMRFGGRGCGFGTLDLSQCARWMELADVRGCPSLALLYVASGQRFGALRFDGPTKVVER